MFSLISGRDPPATVPSMGILLRCLCTWAGTVHPGPHPARRFGRPTLAPSAAARPAATGHWQPPADPAACRKRCGGLPMKLGLALGYSGAHLDIPVALVQRAEALGYDT